MFKMMSLGILGTWWLWQKPNFKLPEFAHKNSTLRLQCISSKHKVQRSRSKSLRATKPAWYQHLSRKTLRKLTGQVKAPRPDTHWTEVSSLWAVTELQALFLDTERHICYHNVSNKEKHGQIPLTRSSVFLCLC